MTLVYDFSKLCVHHALIWWKGTGDLHCVVLKLAATDSCAICIFMFFMLKFLGERSFCLISKSFRMCSWIVEYCTECDRNVHHFGCKPSIEVKEPVNCTLRSRNYQPLSVAQTFYMTNEVCLISKCLRLCPSIAEHWSERNRNVHRCGCKSWIDVRTPVSRSCQRMTLA